MNALRERASLTWSELAGKTAEEQDSEFEGAMWDLLGMGSDRELQLCYSRVYDLHRQRKKAVA